MSRYISLVYRKNVKLTGCYLNVIAKMDTNWCCGGKQNSYRKTL